MVKKQTFKQAAKSEAAAIDGAIIQTAKKARGYWNILGPGLTTGASDDDPSGIATYSQTGSQYGFQLLAR